MATPVGPTGTASQAVNTPVSEARPKAEQAEPKRVEETRAAEQESTDRRKSPDPDSNTGQNIDTTA